MAYDQETHRTGILGMLLRAHVTATLDPNRPSVPWATGGPLAQALAHARPAFFEDSPMVPKGLIILTGKSGSGKSVLLASWASNLGLPVLAAGEPDSPDPLSPLGLSWLVRAILGHPINEAADAEDYSLDKPNDDPDPTDSDYDPVSMVAEMLQKSAAPSAFVEGVERSIKRGIIFVDGLTPLLYLIPGAAAAGGYPRALTYALLAINQLARARNITVVASFNPYASKDESLDLMNTMIEGSTVAYIEVVGAAQSSGASPLASVARRGSTAVSLTVNFSARPSLRGAMTARGIQIAIPTISRST
jgi:hypothetical protein